jgi:MFS family permease
LYSIDRTTSLNRPYSKDPQVEKSLQHSIKDGVSYAAMSGVSESYFSVYAVFLKASTQQIALLASLPPLVASFWQLFAVWLGQTTGTRKGIIVMGALLQVASLVMLAILPPLVPDMAFPALLACIIIYFSGANLGAPLWGSLMGAIVPEALRGRFFAARTRMSTVASFSALIIGGVILQIHDRLDWTQRGFLTIFALGVVARLISAWHLHRLHDPPHGRAIEGDVTSLFSIRFFKGQQRLLRFTLFFFCMNFAVAISGPFVVVYLLRDLHFSYIQLTFNTAASILVQFLVLQRWGRLADLFGNRIILRVTGFTIPVIPLLWVLSPDYYYLLLVQALSGLAWSGFSLSASNFVFDLTPQEKRAGLMATHSVVSNIALFLGASLGGYLAVHLTNRLAIGPLEFAWLSSFYGVFLASSLLRLAVAWAFLPGLEEVRTVRRMSYSGLIFRVTRFSPISGVIFDIVGRRPRNTPSADPPPDD